MLVLSCILEQCLMRYSLTFQIRHIYRYHCFPIQNFFPLTAMSKLTKKKATKTPKKFTFLTWHAVRGVITKISMTVSQINAIKSTMREIHGIPRYMNGHMDVILNHPEMFPTLAITTSVRIKLSPNICACRLIGFRYADKLEIVND